MKQKIDLIDQSEDDDNLFLSLTSYNNNKDDL